MPRTISGCPTACPERSRRVSLLKRGIGGGRSDWSSTISRNIPRTSWVGRLQKRPPGSSMVESHPVWRIHCSQFDTIRVSNHPAHSARQATVLASGEPDFYLRETTFLAKSFQFLPHAIAPWRKQPLHNPSTIPHKPSTFPYRFSTSRAITSR